MTCPRLLHVRLWGGNQDSPDWTEDRTSRCRLPKDHPGPCKWEDE